MLLGTQTVVVIVPRYHLNMYISFTNLTTDIAILWVSNSHSLLKATLYSAPLQNSTLDGLKLIKVAKCQEVQFTILHKGQFSNPLIIIGEYEVGTFNFL